MNTEQDLGFVQAILVSTSSPTNTMQIWFDDNIGEKIHKVYDTVLGVWVTLSPNIGLGFGVYTLATTNSVSISVLQSTHGIIEISGIKIDRYLPMPDDYYEFVDLLSENITYRIFPNFDVEVDNPNGLYLQVKISGRK